MILAIETATEVCGVALVDRGEEKAARIVAEPNIHGERLMPLVDETLRAAGVPLRGVDAVAISIGPGSFTGLRIGLSTAKGLALSAQKPLVTVPTLAALALAAYRRGTVAEGGLVAPVIDAKRDEAFYALFQIHGGDPRRLLPDGIDHAEAIVAQLRARGSVVIAGTGSGKLRAAAPSDSGFTFTAEACHPAAVGIFGERAGTKLDAAAFADIEPAYLREFVTTTPRRHQRISAAPAEG